MYTVIMLTLYVYGYIELVNFIFIPPRLPSALIMLISIHPLLIRAIKTPVITTADHVHSTCNVNITSGTIQPLSEGGFRRGSGVVPYVPLGYLKKHGKVKKKKKNYKSKK